MQLCVLKSAPCHVSTVLSVSQQPEALSVLLNSRLAFRRARYSHAFLTITKHMKILSSALESNISVLNERVRQLRETLILHRQRNDAYQVALFLDPISDDSVSA